METTTTTLITPQAQPVQPHGRIETASNSAAALAKASVEARYIMAMQCPRNWDTVRLKILDECRRLSFAEVARYSKPVAGQKVEGPSIRFAEAASRCMNNVLVEVAIVHEDERQRIIRVTATDLESNLTSLQDILIEKQVERKNPSGRTVIRQRLNSKNEHVYIVEATEDELVTKAAALISKARRAGILQLLPGDILDEAMTEVIRTVQKRDKEDPAAARKRVCDAFYTLGVSPDSIVEYLGHPIDQCSPAQLQDLRQIHTTIKEGETTWAQVMEAKGGAKENGNGKAKGKGNAAPRAEALKASLLEGGDS